MGESIQFTTILISIKFELLVKEAFNLRKLSVADWYPVVRYPTKLVVQYLYVLVFSKWQTIRSVVLLINCSVLVRFTYNLVPKETKACSIE